MKKTYFIENSPQQQPYISWVTSGSEKIYFERELNSKYAIIEFLMKQLKSSNASIKTLVKNWKLKPNESFSNTFGWFLCLIIALYIGWEVLSTSGLKLLNSDF